MQAGITGKWESFFVQIVPDPLPGIASALVLAGSISGEPSMQSMIFPSRLAFLLVLVGRCACPAQGRPVCEAGQIPTGGALGKIPRNIPER